MPNLRDIRRRIRSVKSTQQVTRAMKIVAAAKLRRAQDAIVATRPYARQMLQVLVSLAARASREDHPLLQERGFKNVEVMIVTADKGLCGPFNTNIIRRANEFLAEHEGEVLTLHTVGRRGRDFFKRRKRKISREYLDVSRNVQYSHAERIASDLIERYVGRDLDAVYMIYNEFKSIMRQEVVMEQLLPIPRLEEPEQGATMDYIYEPSARELLEALLPRHVEYQVLRALLESAAAEHAARMTAMDSATRNAGDLIQELTRTMNRVRQATITRELIEVVSGAEAL